MKHSRAPLLYYITLCAAFQSHWFIQTGVRVQKRSIRVKIGDFVSPVTLAIDGWPWKTKGPIFYTTSNFVHHFKSIDEVTLETHRRIQTGVTVRKSLSRVKISDFLSRATLKFDGWPWKTIGRLFLTLLSFAQHFKAIGIFKLELQSGNAQFGSKFVNFCPPRPWKLTDDIKKNNRAPLLRCFKLYASVHSHWWIQTGVTVWKRPIRVKIDAFFSRVTLKFDGWPWKTIRHLF